MQFNKETSVLGFFMIFITTPLLLLLLLIYLFIYFIKSSWTISHVIWLKDYQCFMDRLCPHHQGYDVTVCLNDPLHTHTRTHAPTCPQPIFALSTSQWEAGGQGQVLVLSGFVSEADPPIQRQAQKT
jgi:hypothetical protein